LGNKDYRKSIYAIEQAKKNNQNSLSNGSIMRCTPMVVWTSNLETDD
jgi:ADP-ribosylglycohydrolase